MPKICAKFVFELFDSLETRNAAKRRQSSSVEVHLTVEQR